jgi:hypothetical protein
VPELISLLDALGETGIEASLITTFNAYLPFYEDVVLRRLLANGCRHNTVLMDAAQLSSCLEDPVLRPTGAGFDYTLASIRSKAAFHPKLMLMVGPKRAITCVGSHNLTLSGFGLNREATCKMVGFGGDDQGSDIARAAWRLTKDWLEGGGTSLPRQTQRNILAIEDIAPWLRTAGAMREECRLLYQAPGTLPLWEQLLKLTASPVKRIIVIGAFFDARCEFMHTLESTFPSAKILVAIEPETVHLTQKGADRIRGSWRDASKLIARAGYLHAKIIYFDTGGRTDVLAFGSANPSAPAWGLGKGERNEELIIAWTGPRAREFADQLGLGGVKDLPEIDAHGLLQIDAAAAGRQESQRTGSPNYTVAAVTPDGIEIAAEGLADEAVSMDALDDRADVVAGNLGCTRYGDIVRAALARDVAERVRFVRVAFRRGAAVILICHHAEHREAAARTGRQAQLRKALASLEGDPANIATLIAAVQKVVFGPDARAEQLVSPPGSGRGRAARDDDEVTTLEGTADAAGKKRARPRLAGGDLGYLLQALIYELGKSLPTSAAGASMSGRSEEEQVNADDETPPEQVIPFESDRELAEACGCKAGTLVNRMVRVLHEGAQSPEAALTTVAQLTAVLCTLRALRQLDRQERWRRTGLSLVPEDYRHTLFDGILDTVIGGSRPLMRRPGVIAVGHSMEVVHLRGLMVWLAWECKFRADRKFALGDEIEDRDYNVLQRGALLELVLPVLPDVDAREEAERSVQATASPRQTLSAGQWLQAHFAWGRRIARSAAQTDEHPQKGKGYLPVGSIVALPRSLGHSLHVVAGQDRANVVVFVLCAKNREREFLPEKVFRVAPP